MFCSRMNVRFAPILLKKSIPKAVGFLEKDWCGRSEIMWGPSSSVRFSTSGLGSLRSNQFSQNDSIYVSRKFLAASVLSFST